MTPMMEQYFEIKDKYKDYIVFYRLGDFYEMFFDDAVVASRELELTLTGRDCGEAERAPMCGVPFHSSEGYIGKLIEKGYKVAICEQTEDPALAKGRVKREVVRVITPGTLIEAEFLPEKKNNYLCAVYMGEFDCGVAFGDISTAEIFATTFCGDEINVRLKNEIGIYQPSEIVVIFPRSVWVRIWLILFATEWEQCLPTVMPTALNTRLHGMRCQSNLEKPLRTEKKRTNLSYAPLADFYHISTKLKRVTFLT